MAMLTQSPLHPNGSMMLRMEQLEPYLRQPFSVRGATEDSFWTLPQIEVMLAQAVAESINRHEDGVFVVPFVTSWTLAFLVRALIVATVSRPPLSVYSPDPNLPACYRNLTTPAGEPLWHAWPLLQSAKKPKNSCYAHLIRSFLEMENAAIEGPLIVDGRGIRTASAAERMLAASAEARGRRAVLVLSNHHPSVLSLVSKGFHVEFAPFLPDLAPRDGAPKALAEYLERTNNFARGVRLQPVLVDRACPPLQRLEQAHQALAREVASIGKGWPSFLSHADQFNHITQTALIPLTITKESAHGLERLWLDAHLRALQLAIDQNCPPHLSARIRDFIAAGLAVEHFLESAHPPKVEWLLNRMREDCESETLRIYCRTELEAATLRAFQTETHEVRRMHLEPIPRRNLQGGAIGRNSLLVPGPPSRADLSLLLSGFAQKLVILRYPWEAPRWNAFLRRASTLVPSDLLPEINREEEAYEDSDEDRIVFSTSAILPSEEDVVRATLRKSRSANTYSIPTDMGYRDYNAGALVPKLYAGKFVDLPVERLREGDTIMVRSDAYPIDSRTHVDGLARTHTTFAEAAELASLWWLCFVRFAREELGRNGGSLLGLYIRLFPDRAVTFQTFSNWFLGELRAGHGGSRVKLISPLPENLEKLLTRIGLSSSAASELQRYITRYRGLRQRAYNYLAHRCRECASDLAGRKRPGNEESLLVDGPVDAEMGLLLSSLDDLIKFAKVTGPPFRRHQ